VSSGDYRDEGIVDVDRRRNQAEYVLGDPTLFPVEFLNWIIRWVESSGITFPFSSIVGRPSGGVLSGWPAGIILPFAGPTPPVGSLPCVGASLLRTDWPFLFGAIDVTWGAVDGTHFNTPDLRDRALFGTGSLVLGQTDGSPVGSRGPSHHHITPREVVSLQPGGTGYSIFGSRTLNDIKTTGGPLQDRVGHANVLYVITTGQ
jgi:hypothetical protein